MVSKKELLANTKKYYLLNFFRECQFIIPVIVLFWQANGLSLSQIMLLQTIYALGIFLLEVPTGSYADRVGRKQSIVLGTFILFIGAVVYSLGTNFWQFAVAELFWALGTCYMSGANSALIYESLKQNKKEKNFKKVWGHVQSFGYLAVGITGIIGGFVAVHSLRFNWVLVSVFMLAMFFVALTLKEPKHLKKIEEKSYFKHVKESFIEAFSNKNLLFLLLFFSLLSAMSRITLWFYQPYLQQSGVDVVYFGFIWASFSLLAIFGSSSAHKLENFLGEKWSLWLMIILYCFGSIFMGFFFVLFGFLFIFMHQFIRGFNKPVLDDYTNRHLDQEKRATLMSIQSLAGSLVFAVLGPIYGWIADKFSLNTALIFTGVSFFIAFSILMIWNKLRK